MNSTFRVHVVGGAMLSLALFTIPGCTNAVPGSEGSFGDTHRGALDNAAGVRPIDFSLPKADLTLLVAQEFSELEALEIVHLGAESYSVPVANPPTEWIREIHAHGDEFHLLTFSGEYHIVDSERAETVHSVATNVLDPVDFVRLQDSLLVTSMADTTLRKLDAHTGAPLAELVVLPEDDAHLTHMRAIGGRLFVQVNRISSLRDKRAGALVVVDLATFSVEKIIELAVPDEEDPTQTRLGVNPKDRPVYDEARQRLYVTCKDVYRRGSGILLAVDLTTLELLDWYDAPGARQGPIAIVGGKSFLSGHTSTPTVSTHVKWTPLDDLGFPNGPGAGDPKVLDVFQELREFPVSQDGAFVLFRASCATGFCPGGSHITLFDVETNEQHKIPEDVLGIRPSNMGLAHAR